MKILIVALIAALAAPCIAQEKADPELAAAIAERDAGQAKIDAIMASRELAVQQAVVEAVFPGLSAVGVTLTLAPDPLYTVLDVPYGKASASDRLLWREARLRALEEVGSGALIETDVPWRWLVHRADLVRVCSAMTTVMAPQSSPK